MGREIKRLSPRAVETITKVGRHADGGNLYLSISENGGKRWTFLYRWHGRPVELGFGSARLVSLATARKLAGQARDKIAEGINPKDARKPRAGSTFGECADRLIAAMSPGWRSAKHLEQWKMTMGDTYCRALRRLPVDQVNTDDVLAVLQPVWQSKPETASRLRGRIERVLDAAKAQTMRSGENPARWRGHLDQLLSKRQQIQRGHHAAMPYVDVPAFISDLQTREAIAARSLEFLILTAARSGEVRGSRWTEFDLDGAVWTVPPERMKAGREHRVPLSGRALEIVRALHEVRLGDFVFPGQARGKPQSTMALDMVLRRMRIEGATVHGFRSSFRDWAGNETSFPRELAETALAHVIGDKAEQAYRRGDALEKRRALMQSWSDYCARTNNVVPMIAAAR